MAENSLKDKIAVVTGGTRGIGRAIAEALLAAQARVVVCGRSQQGVDRAVSEMSPQGAVSGKVCDVADYGSVREFFFHVGKQHGRLDVLVNNAGVGVFSPVDQITPEDWRQVIATNLDGVFYCVREAVPLMKAAGGGFIVNIGSLAGKNPFAGGSAYNASKFGLNGFTEAIMMDLRYENIRVTQIMPGSVQTGFGRGGVEGAGWKLDPAQIGATVVHLLQMPERNLASRVEMRPSRPPRK